MAICAWTLIQSITYLANFDGIFCDWIYRKLQNSTEITCAQLRGLFINYLKAKLSENQYQVENKW